MASVAGQGKFAKLLDPPSQPDAPCPATADGSPSAYLFGSYLDNLSGSPRATPIFIRPYSDANSAPSIRIMAQA